MKKRKYITAAELEDIKSKDIMEHSRLATLIVYKNLKLVPPMTEMEKSNWKTRQIFNPESITPEMKEEYNARCYESKVKEGAAEFSASAIFVGEIIDFEEKGEKKNDQKRID